MFNLRTSFNIGRSLFLGRRNPVYVQYYVTARCNLTCKQCNIIYANANVSEATTEEADRIAHNLAKLGTAIVLLTGGEPFLRKDLPDIIRSFTSRGIHVRTQTNGIASPEQLQAAREAGAKDISISLDSLLPAKQEFLNGSHDKSWGRAIDTIAKVTQNYPAQKSFAAFGTVLSPSNFLEIPNIIRFATKIGWYVSLVPAHIADPASPMNFRSYDREMIFHPDLYPLLDQTLDECIALKKQGYLLYDSPEYLRNVRRFVKGERIDWRRRNAGRCDSPELYFAIRPNGDMQVCCDHVLKRSYPVWHDDFPQWYREKKVHAEIHPIAQACSGCMYGSFPEVSITAHYPLTTAARMGVFWKARAQKPWPLTSEKLHGIINDINASHPVDHSRTANYIEKVARHELVTISSRKKMPNLPVSALSAPADSSIATSRRLHGSN